MELSQSDRSVIDKLVKHFKKMGVVSEEPVAVSQDEAEVDAMMMSAAAFARSEREIRPDNYAGQIDEELSILDSIEEDWKNPYET